MPYGYTGKILRVDLSSGRISIDEPPETIYRTYFGGEAFIGYTLLKEVKKGIDPLGPENKLIFAAGPLTGVPVVGCGRHSVGAKSPLTGGFGEAESGGYWGAELKMAGFDAVIIEGKAAKPVYLFILDGKAEIRDARHLWGMKAAECQSTIRAELGDALIKVALIGPAGEKLVRFASISNDLDAFAGRTGLGAVMGSKNLKAVACRGHERVSVARPDEVKEIARWARDNIFVLNKTMHELGTPYLVRPLAACGGLPTRNHQLGAIEGSDKLSGEVMRDTILVRRRGCFACSLQCKREVKVEQPYPVDARYGAPEYETLAAFGSDCGITDLGIVCKAQELAGAYGVDSISCGVAIAFAMECFEKGILNRNDTDGLELAFGNEEAMLGMIERIVLRQGLGDILAEGVARAAKRIGNGAEAFAMHIKGLELPVHEPRWKQGMGIGFAVSPTGADHCHNIHDVSFVTRTPLLQDLQAFGILEPLPVNDLSPAKMRLLVYYANWQHFMNCAVCCIFVMVSSRFGHDRAAQLTRAVTGWNTSVLELFKVGERAANLGRAFNLREGFTASDDSMPERFFTPQASGPLKGVALDHKIFEEAKEAYYGIMGWPDGFISKGKLWELGLDWVIPHLYDPPAASR